MVPYRYNWKTVSVKDFVLIGAVIALAVVAYFALPGLHCGDHEELSGGSDIRFEHI